MHETSLNILLSTALSIAVLHTFIGVDHYLPFVVLGRARQWSVPKALGITAICGVGHVIGSIVLGFVGIGIGVAIERLEWIESFRGNIAAWGLIAFGLVYAAWSAVRAARGRSHAHVHAHRDGTLHAHTHDHVSEHLHVHEAEQPGQSLAFWSLFIIFVFGPCEPLIPLLMVPAFEHHWLAVAAVAAVFSVATIGTMLILVAFGIWGLRLAPLERLGRYANTLAGLAIAASGLAIQLLGI
jgi:sulfite exporter TauE/SafE